MFSIRIRYVGLVTAIESYGPEALPRRAPGAERVRPQDNRCTSISRGGRPGRAVRVAVRVRIRSRVGRSAVAVAVGRGSGRALAGGALDLRQSDATPGEPPVDGERVAHNRLLVRRASARVAEACAPEQKRCNPQNIETCNKPQQTSTV